MSGQHIMIVTGEASGDMHGANLIKAMKEARPELTVAGMGGEALAAQGMEVLFDAAKLSVVGLWEIFGHLGDIRAARRILISHMEGRKPDLLILIDLPDFNLMLAAKAKSLGIPVFYYISPQVWAWRSGRVRKIRKLVDRMAVILPFEKDFYREKGMDVDFVGHPLLDEISAPSDRKRFLAERGINADGRSIIGILPGSRRKEIASMLPVFIESAKLLEKELGKLLFLLPVAPTLRDDDLAGHGLEDCGLDIRKIRGERYSTMSACDAVIAASGTVTLELAILKVPMVVSYRVSPLSFFIGRRFIKVEHASLVNLIAGREVVRELIQADARPEKISAEVSRLVSDSKYRKDMLRELGSVSERLGAPGASERAAKIALSMVVSS